MSQSAPHCWESHWIKNSWLAILFFQYFNYFSLLPSGCHCHSFNEKLPLYGDSLYMIHFFSLASCRTLSSSLTFDSLTTLCLERIIFKFILLMVPYVLEFSCSCLTLNLEIFCCYFFDYSSCPFLSFLLFWNSHCVLAWDCACHGLRKSPIYRNWNAPSNSHETDFLSLLVLSYVS